MKTFDIKKYEPDLERFEIWNLVYERDDVIKKLTRALSSGKNNNCTALAQMLESLLHDRLQREELGMRLVEAMEGLIKQNQELKALTAHFTITTPKK